MLRAAARWLGMSHSAKTGRLVGEHDNNALRTVAARYGTPPQPDNQRTPTTLTDGRARAGRRVMRVNHVGEVCAPGAVPGAGLTARTLNCVSRCNDAAREETDRPPGLDRRAAGRTGHQPSRLNPLWYAGAFAIGLPPAAWVMPQPGLRDRDRTSRSNSTLAGHLDHCRPPPLARAPSSTPCATTKLRHTRRRLARRRRRTRVCPPVRSRWLMRLAARVATPDGAR